MKYVTFRASQHRRTTFVSSTEVRGRWLEELLHSRVNERFVKEVLSKLTGTGLEFDFEKKRGQSTETIKLQCRAVGKKQKQTNKQTATLQELSFCIQTTDLSTS